MIYCMAIILSSSIAYRLRGMGLPFGTTSGRLLWSAVCGVVGFGLFGYGHGVAAMLGAYLGMMFSHSKWYLFQRPIRPYDTYAGWCPSSKIVSGLPSVGRTYYTWLEKATASGTITWYGNSQNGITGTWNT